jgi:pimeloyl-ACP methyl ester carboxylesterase
MPMFTLVHGAWHDGWCWHLLEEELRRRGHETVAPTLPVDDVGASFEDYVDVVADAVGPVREPVVVVGHSVAGRWLHLLGERLEVARAVYVCARYPDHADDPAVFRPDAQAGDGTDASGRSTWSVAGATRMYARLPEALAAEAAARLRPQWFGMIDRDAPPPDLRALPAAAVACRDDELFTVDYQRWAARELLGVEPAWLDGGHCPMLEQPDRLADLLGEVA